ncbi:short-chain dehydrogenase/reductase family oxidoreductase [Colletotrichum tabaci]|uniref:Short-chain dehydrogenase/reductase family oxidoreductase n=1 Tax=Colletotrichum tabaci TaxID=1209068 RepID=A0AAV9TG58_9PEZI
MTTVREGRILTRAADKHDYISKYVTDQARLRVMSNNPSSAAPPMTNHMPAPPPQMRAPQLQTAWERHAGTGQHNSSVRHPVFFTEKLRRPPPSLGPGMGMSPVAHGYVYQDGRRADVASTPKL